MDVSVSKPPRVRIIVCQASYGDTLGIEIDPEPKGGNDRKYRVESKTRRFMLIDGGLATVKATGKVGEERIPLYVSLFY